MPGNVFTAKLLDVIVAGDSQKKIEGAKGIFLVLTHHPTDLQNVLKLTRPECLSEVGAKMMIYSLLCGLNFLHQAGIMHRDITPSNLLVNADSSVSICDFGCARPIPKKRSVYDGIEDVSFTDVSHNVSYFDKNTGTAQANTTPGDLTKYIGTPGYISPEMILYQDEYDGQLDLWSSGCILAELMVLLNQGKKNSIYGVSSQKAMKANKLLFLKTGAASCSAKE